MKSLALTICITILTLGSVQAQSQEKFTDSPTENKVMKKDSNAIPKTSLTKENKDPFPISEAEMMEYQQSNYPISSENNTTMNMEWALVKSDIPNKKKIK